MEQLRQPKYIITSHMFEFMGAVTGKKKVFIRYKVFILTLEYFRLSRKIAVFPMWPCKW